MKVLVLGGSGFIGSHVVDTLLKNGHTVRVFDHAQERFRQTPVGVEFHPGSLDDSSAMAAALSDIDMVFHLVSTTVPGTANLDPVADIHGNLLPTIKLLELMRMQGVKRLLYLSSGGTVYGVTQTGLVDEEHPLQPVNSYGIVKVAIENYIRMEAYLHGLEAVILRPSNPFGSRQGHGGVQGVINTYLWKIARNEPVQIWGDGSVVRDFLHVSDLSQLCLACAEQGTTGTFNAGAGEGHSIRQVLDTIIKVSGRTVTTQFQPGRPYDVPKVVLNTSTVTAATGWKPQISFTDGIFATWEWVLAQSEFQT